MPDIEVTLTDIDGIKDRVRTIDRLYDSFVNGPFILSNCTVAETLSVGYPSQIQNSSYQLDVNGKVWIAHDTEIQENVNIGGALYVNNYTTLNKHLTCEDYVNLNSSLHVLGKVRAETDTAVYGKTYMDRRLDVSGNTSVWTDLEVLKETTLQGNTRVFGKTYLDKRLDVSGNTSVWTDLEVLKETTLQGDIRVFGKTYLDKQLDVSANVSLWSNLEVLKRSTFQDNTTFNKVNTFNGPNTIINSSVLDIRTLVNLTGDVYFKNENAGKAVYLDVNTPIISKSSVDVVTLKYAQLERLATTSQIFTGGQSVNRLVVRDFINTVDPNVSTSTNMMNIDGFVAFQTDFTVTNQGYGDNVVKRVRKVKIGTTTNPEDQIEYSLFANASSTQFVNGNFDMTTQSIGTGIDYTGNVLFKGVQHGMNTSTLTLDNDRFELTSRSGVYNITNTALNLSTCDTQYKGRVDLTATSILKGIAYTGPVAWTGNQRINSSNTSLICDNYSLIAPSGSITANPTDFTVVIKKGIVSIDDANVAITNGTFDLNSRALGLGINYVGNLNLSGSVTLNGDNTITSGLTKATITELNLSAYRGKYWIENTSMILRNCSLNFSGSTFVEGTYDMNTSSMGNGIVYKGDVTLTGKNTIESTLTQMSISVLNASIEEFNLSAYRGMYWIENTSMILRNCSLNFSGSTFVEGTYDMNTSSMGSGIVYKGDVTLTGKNTIVSTLTNANITELNLSAYRGQYWIENTSMILRNCSLNFSGSTFVEGTYDMNTSSMGSGIVYKGDVTLTGKNTIVSTLTNATITELNLSAYRGQYWIENTSMTLRNCSLNFSGSTFVEGTYDMNTSSMGSGIVYKGDVTLTGKNTIDSTLTNATITELNLTTKKGKVQMENTSFDITGSRFFMTGRTKLEGNVSLVSTVTIDVTPAINITTRNNYNKPSLVLDNTIKSNDMFLRMDNGTTQNVFGEFGAQIKEKLRLGYNVNLAANNTLDFSAYHLDVNGKGHFTGDLMFDQNVQISKVLNCSHINTYGSSIHLTSGNISTTGHMLVNKIEATGDITCVSVNTQNNPITMGTGVLTLSGDINCSKIDTKRASIRSGTINSLNLSCLAIETQNNNVTMGTGVLSLSGDINCSKINTYGSDLNMGIGSINCSKIDTNRASIKGGTINSLNLSCLAIETQNNNVTMGTGSLSLSGDINCSKIDTFRSSIRGGTINSLNISCLAIETQNNNVTMGTGSLSLSGDINCSKIDTFRSSIRGGTINSLNISCLAIETQNNNIMMGTGFLTVQNISCSNLSATTLVIGTTIDSQVTLNSFGQIHANQFSSINGNVGCITLKAGILDSIFGNTTDKVTINTGSITTTGNINVSGNLALTGTLKMNGAFTAAGNISAPTGTFTDSLGTNVFTADRINLRPSTSNTQKSYYFNEKGDINCSSITADNSCVFNNSVTANIFKTNPLFGMTNFQVNTFGHIECVKVNASSLDEHRFGTVSDGVTLTSGAITAKSDSAHTFGKTKTKTVTLTEGSIDAKGSITAVGTITCQSNLTNTFGDTADSGWVTMKQGTITATGENSHTFGTDRAGKVTLDDGAITATSTGKNTFGNATNNVAIEGGAVTATHKITALGLYTTNETYYLNATELKCNKIWASSTAAGTNHIIGNIKITGNGEITDVNTLTVFGTNGANGLIKSDSINGYNTEGTQNLYTTKTAGALRVLGSGTATLVVYGNGIETDKINTINTTGTLNICNSQTAGGTVNIGSTDSSIEIKGNTIKLSPKEGTSTIEIASTLGEVNIAGSRTTKVGYCNVTIGSKEHSTVYIQGGTINIGEHKDAIVSICGPLSDNKTGGTVNIGRPGCTLHLKEHVNLANASVIGILNVISTTQEHTLGSLKIKGNVLNVGTIDGITATTDLNIGTSQTGKISIGSAGSTTTILGTINLASIAVGTSPNAITFNSDTLKANKEAVDHKIGKINISSGELTSASKIESDDLSVQNIYGKSLETSLNIGTTQKGGTTTLGATTVATEIKGSTLNIGHDTNIVLSSTEMTIGTDTLMTNKIRGINVDINRNSTGTTNIGWTTTNIKGVTNVYGTLKTNEIIPVSGAELTLGGSTATAITIGSANSITTINGTMTITGYAKTGTANSFSDKQTITSGGLSVTGITDINTAGTENTTIGNSTGRLIVNGGIKTNTIESSTVANDLSIGTLERTANINIGTGNIKGTAAIHQGVNIMTGANNEHTYIALGSSSLGNNYLRGKTVKINNENYGDTYIGGNGAAVGTTGNTYLYGPTNIVGTTAINTTGTENTTIGNSTGRLIVNGGIKTNTIESSTVANDLSIGTLERTATINIGTGNIKGTAAIHQGVNIMTGANNEHTYIALGSSSLGNNYLRGKTVKINNENYGDTYIGGNGAAVGTGNTYLYGPTNIVGTTNINKDIANLTIIGKIKITNGDLTDANAITSTTFNANSDQRVKTKIQDLSKDHSLRTLRALRPKTYDFTDQDKKGCIGFIAQDIQRLDLPVHKSTRVVGNIQQDVICNEGWFRTEYPLRIGNKIQLSGTIYEIIEEQEDMFRIQEPLTGIYFLYGTEVDDFLSIEKDAIFTVAVSALQAIDDRLVAQQRRLDFLIQIFGCALFYSLGASLYVLFLSK